MRTFRTGAHLGYKSAGWAKDVFFGQNLVQLSKPGEIVSVGDAVVATPRRAPGFFARGVKGVDMRAQYPKGREVYWWAFSSTTKQLSTLTNDMFLGKTGVRTVFNIQVLSGVDIDRYSAFSGAEAEVLLFPGTKLVVVDSMDMGAGLFQVQLREVAVPVALIK